MGLVWVLSFYFISWWLVFLVVLPLGTPELDKDKTLGQGHDSGAPIHPHLGRKLITTSWVTALWVLVIWLGVHYQLMPSLK